jgi:hypothetical protein
VTTRRLVSLVVLIVLAAPVSSCGGDDDGSPPALTRAGRTLWQFEALLNDTFGGRSVSARYDTRTGMVDFACAGDCGPLSEWSEYAFVFRNARRSSFRLVDARLPSFGVHPIPVKIRGQYVACGSTAGRYLITYHLGAGLSLACLRNAPQR